MCVLFVLVSKRIHKNKTQHFDSIECEKQHVMVHVYLTPILSSVRSYMLFIVLETGALFWLRNFRWRERRHRSSGLLSRRGIFFDKFEPPEAYEDFTDTILMITFVESRMEAPRLWAFGFWGACMDMHGWGLVHIIY